MAMPIKVVCSENSNHNIEYDNDFESIIFSKCCNVYRTEDMVNSPPHYKTKKGIECIDAIEAALEGETNPFIAMCRGNAIKYLWRSGKKDKAKTIEDYEKAIWYINRAIQGLKSNDS